MNTWPHRRAFAAFPKQNDKCPGRGWARLELTEPLTIQISKIYNKRCDHHVTSIGQRKNLSPQQELNL